MSIAARARPFGPRHRWLLAGSLLVWAASTLGIFWLSLQDAASLLGCSVLGGVTAAVLGTLRSMHSATFRPDAWIVFRMITTVAGGGIWMLILQDLSRQSDISSRWTGFCLGLLVYTLVRDVLHTLLTAISAKKQARLREQARVEQRDRVLQLLASRAPASRTTATIYYLPVE